MNKEAINRIEGLVTTKHLRVYIRLRKSLKREIIEEGFEEYEAEQFLNMF